MDEIKDGMLEESGNTDINETESISGEDAEIYNTDEEIPDDDTEEKDAFWEIDDFSDENVSDEDKSDEADSTSDEEESVSDSGSNTAEDSSEPSQEAAQEAEKPKLKLPWKIIGIIAASVAGAAAIAYLGGAIFYNSHFYPGTTLGGFSCANLTVEEAEEKIMHDIENYTYTIRERGREEYIHGKDISLTCTTLEGIRDAKESQNPFGWLTNTEARKCNIDIGVSYDEDALYRLAEQLECTKESITGMDGAAAGVYYENGVYNMRENTAVNIISFSKLFSALKAGVYGLYTDISLEDEGIYVSMAQEDHLKAAMEEMNKYVSANITYTKGSETFVVNGDLINTWLTLNPDYTVTLDESKAAAYVNNLAGSYNTVGAQRTFTASYGAAATVSGGDYGWRLAKKTETAALINHIKNGETIVKEPAFDQRGGSYGPNNDLPNTYVEISLSRQHLWFYKDGKIEVSTDFVSGNPYKGNGTTPGIYRLKYKERNATLKGEDYETPVSYWMPFNGGQGMHDANWRGAFGGSIYLGGGSHGCVNLPTSAAAAIYAKISAGDPVIVY